MDQDTDFARLADIGDRKRTSSHCIDVPAVHGSRKRRPSTSQEENVKEGENPLNECTAALVLMSLSCSPHSPSLNGMSWNGRVSPSPSLTDSWRSSTPSPPLSEGGGWANTSTTDEGIVIDDDFDELPRKKKANRMVFQCTWPGCLVITTTCSSIEAHVRKAHLGDRRGDDEGCMDDDHEEEFYYTEVELGLTSSPPTLSHRDMARPPHEDPEYQRSLQMAASAPHPTTTQPPPSSLSALHHTKPISVPPQHNGGCGSSLLPQWTLNGAPSPNSPQKYMRLSSSVPSVKQPNSPTRKARGDTKKCRKVYGMEHREQWCTQCKWKKACTRFGD
ncbi:hypothetical protein LSTR_LSTR010013 [Laodelphax striatellus]|uniref:C2H2-type domain-containing protein n=1 Tax=Laodelphax striatellus TaxID=195883 RepID=A0A482WR08_LAOST|nr:hypothetical protein LSTR_LSTR010013 [Laodelphax striatellus]